MKLPVNRPLAPVDNNYLGGQLDHGGRTSDVNYFPPATGPKATDAWFRAAPHAIDATIDAKPIAETDKFAQAGHFWCALKDQDMAYQIANLSGDLNVVTSARTRTIMVSYFYQAVRDFETRLATATNVLMAEVSRAVAQYCAAEKTR